MIIVANSRSPRPLCLILGIGILLGDPMTTAARAQTSSPATQVTHPIAADAALADDGGLAFDIPAQPLDSALARYFRITGVQFLYDSSLTTGRRSTAVQGHHATRQALRILLAGTGLVARYSGASAATIVAAGTDRPTHQVSLGRVIVRERIAAPRLPMLDRLAYYNRLEDELRTRLRTDPRTERLIFRIVVGLSVDGDGHILGLRIDRQSRRGDHDRSIVDVLEGMTVSRPPPGLIQPLSIVLTGRRP